MISFTAKGLQASVSSRARPAPPFLVPLLEPPTRSAPRERRPQAPAPAGIAARVEALATRRNALLLLGAAVLGALALFVLRPTYPNYDSYYTLLWGEELAAGRLPDYDVLRTPTPHPLATVVAAALSLSGDAADRVLVLLTLGAHLALLALLFRLTQLLLGTLVALVAVAVLLTRTDLEFFTLRAIVDVPFLALVFAAAVLELERPRRGLAVLVPLLLAGLLRPEAWVLSGAYVLWLWPRVGLRGFLAYGTLTTLAPLTWFAADWIVTGEPLYSLTSTREVAGQFQRQRTVGEALLLIPDYIGGNEKIVNVVAGGLGGLVALWILRARAALPLALAGIGIAVFLAIAAAGLSVIPRYLVIPSLVLNLCVAAALAGWTLVREPRARRVAIGVALLTVALYAFRAPALFKDLQKLNGQTFYVQNQHRALKALVAEGRVASLLRSCAPVTVPTHSAIPVIRYQTGLGKERFEASIAQQRPPERGLLLVGRSFNFEPAAARATIGASSRSARRWWSNYPLSTFEPVAANAWWRVYASGCG